MNTLLTTETTETPTIEKALQIAQNYLSNFASSADFNAKMQLAFGNHKIWGKADLIDFPTIEIRPAAEINNARGAFAATTNTIYLSQELVNENTGNVGAITSVLLEEYGHYIDAQLNVIDSPGDEGELFADLVLGKGLSESELLALWGEDDSAIVVWDGERVSIEQQTFDDGYGETITEQFTGTNDDDVFYSWDGNDTIYGLGGDDYVNLGEDGNKFVDAGDGNDKMRNGGSGNDTVLGGNGDDIINSGDGNDSIDGGDGNDLLWGEGGNDTLIGGDGYNTYSGFDGDDTYIVKVPEPDGGGGGEISEIIGNGGGTDTLILEGGTISLEPPKKGIIGLERGGFALLIDLNKNGTWDWDSDLKGDLIIHYFFQEFPSCEPGVTFIETVGNLSGQEILDYFCNKKNQPSISISNVTAKEGELLNFTVSLSEPSDQVVKVLYTTQEDTATPGEDYFDSSTTIEFQPGEQEKTITIGSLSDTQTEGDENFSVILSEPENAQLSNDKGIGTITDVEVKQPSVSITNATVEEGQPLNFTVRLSEQSDKVVKVLYTTQKDTATPGEDYFDSSTTIDFQPGEVEKTITIGSLTDTETEGDEKFSVILSEPENAKLSNVKADGTITDTKKPSISISDATAEEGQPLKFTISLSRPLEQGDEPVKVTYTTEDTTQDNTATSGQDYNSTSNTIEFVPGGDTKESIEIEVQSLEDTERESDEKFFVTLSNPQNATLDDSQGEGTITKGGQPTISITNANGKEGKQPLEFTVSLSESTEELVTVNYITKGREQDPNLTATADEDFIPVQRQLVFNNGIKDLKISVFAKDDKEPEESESFYLELYDPSNAQLSSDYRGVGTIVDGDEQNKYKKEQKDEWEISKQKAEDIAWSLGTASIVFLFLPELFYTKISSGALAILTAIYTRIALHYDRLAKDPPDPNFTTIVEPITPSLSQQPFTAADLGSQQLADSVNALITNQTQWIGVANALQTSLDRADGAEAAGDQSWQNQQEQAAQQYTLALGALTDPQSQLWANFFNAYQAAGLPALNLTVDDVINYQNQIRANGLSPETVQTLTELGADSTTQQEILNNLLAVDPNQVVALGGGNFPAAIIDPTFLSSISGAAEALDQGIIGGGFISGVVSITAPTPNVTGDGLLTGLAPNTSNAEHMMLTDGADTSLPTTATGQQILALSGQDNLTGTEIADQINGNQGSDTLNGTGGNDTLWGGKASDQIDGGADNDLTSGNDDNDILNGGDGNDSLYGGKRRDILIGGVGDDILAGDAGQDILTGEAGNDTFVLADGEAAAISLQVADVITDFSAGDKIGLANGLTFANLIFEPISLSLNSAAEITATALKVGDNYLGIVAGIIPSSLTNDVFVSV